MIAKHIERKLENDNYKNLALYIFDAQKGKIKGEKTLYHWYKGEAEDYQTGIVEVEATQSMNTRTKIEKTYHLMLSFRPEDESKLNEEIFKEIEKEFAKNLGFENHQRHCGIHKNTNNMHMHIAYNKINPKTYNSLTPYYDHLNLNRTCREIEQKYNLAVDLGIDDKVFGNKNKLTAKAKTFEIYSGVESFESYVKNYKDEIILLLENSKSWQEFNLELAKYGIEYKLKGNGAIFKNLKNNTAIKASSIDRTLSKNNLEKRLGKFIEFEKKLLKKIKQIDNYNLKPLQKHVNTNELYSEFKSELKMKEELIAKLKKNELQSELKVKNKWEEKYKKLETIPMLKHHRSELQNEYKLEEKKELKQIKNEIKTKQKQIKNEYPFYSWNNYLQSKAELGNEIALEVLRSKNMKQTNTNELYSKFKNEMKIRQELLEKLYEKKGQNELKVNEKWEEKYKKLNKTPLINNHRIEQKNIYKLEEREELNEVRFKYDLEKIEINKKYPFNSWNDFLQIKAELGDGEALEFLKSKNIEQKNIDLNANNKYLKEHNLIDKKQLNKEKEIYLKTNILNKDKKTLIYVSKMETLLEKNQLENENKIEKLNDFKYNIDTKGVIIFNLPSGGTIRDTGKEIYFSDHDEHAKNIALKYAQTRWGKNININENSKITFLEPSKSKNVGFGR